MSNKFFKLRLTFRTFLLIISLYTNLTDMIRNNNQVAVTISNDQGVWTPRMVCTHHQWQIWTITTYHVKHFSRNTSHLTGNILNVEAIFTRYFLAYTILPGHLLGLVALLLLHVPLQFLLLAVLVVFGPLVLHAVRLGLEAAPRPAWSGGGEGGRGAVQPTPRVQPQVGVTATAGQHACRARQTWNWEMGCVTIVRNFVKIG